MGQSDRSSTTRSDSQPGSRRPRKVLGRLWSGWRVEILIVALVAVAIFLLVERMQIRETLFGWLQRAVAALESLGGGLVRGLVNLVRNTTLSDLTGYVLLLLAAAFLLWRLRWRLMTMPRFTARRCPRCGGDVHRIHRRPIDRLLNLFVPVARYRCKDRECRWAGLRVRSARHE